MTNTEFSRPRIDDSKDILQLVKSCPPLDVNSEYSYLLLCHHFSNTCVIAKKDSKIIGFLSAFVPPNDKNTLFVWQVAVDENFRGEGLAPRMLFSVLQRPECKNIEFIEATVTPSNKSSYSFFISVASELGTRLSKSSLFTEDKFTGRKHEEENLITIGPFEISKLMEVTA